MTNCNPPARRELATVKVVTPHQIVAAGVQALLVGYGLTVDVEPGTRTGTEPDVVLYDVLGLHQGDGSDLDHWVRASSAVVVAMSRELRPDLGALALQRGADAVVPSGVSADELAGLVKAAVAGDLKRNAHVERAMSETRLGHEVGLTLREAETLGLIVRGISNAEIAATVGLSINSVKSYIRSAYRKIGATSRTQAVSWGVQHGFALSDSGADVLD